MSDPASPVLVLGTMVDFKCNEKGCCCQGWNITWDLDETDALVGAFPAPRRRSLLHLADLFSSVNGGPDKIRLRTVGRYRACQFLQHDGRCEVHANHGVERLPRLCIEYPSTCYERADGRPELLFDAVCPEVIERLDASDEPVSAVWFEPPGGHHVALRAATPGPSPPMTIGGRALTRAEIDAWRDQILAFVADRQRAGWAALDVLSAISWGLARIRAGATALELRTDDDPEPFERFFDDCVSAHSAPLLLRFFASVRRFIFAIDVYKSPEGLEDCLSFDPRWRERFDPRAPELQSLLNRFLGSAFFNAFQRSRRSEELEFRYGNVVHTFATVIRYATGLARWFGRPVDRPIIKAGIAASEFLFRSIMIPADSMPWFDLPEDASDGVA